MSEAHQTVYEILKERAAEATDAFQFCEAMKQIERFVREMDKLHEGVVLSSEELNCLACIDEYGDAATWPCPTIQLIRKYLK